MPRDMSFPAQRGENWNDLYDFIRCVSQHYKVRLHLYFFFNVCLCVDCDSVSAGMGQYDTTVLLIITNFYLYGITIFRFPNDNTKKPFDSIQFSDDPEIRQGLCRV